MATWAGPYACTDCGKPMGEAGTCNDCKVATEKVDEKIRRDLARVSGKGKARR
jgi:hypothetical protein